MSHGKMTVAQAKELQAIHGGRVVVTGLSGDKKASHYNDTSKNVDIVLHREGHHKAVLEHIAMKNRKDRSVPLGMVTEKFHKNMIEGEV